MRFRSFVHSIGVMLCVVSLTAPGCGRLDGEPEDQVEVETSALELEAAPVAHPPIAAPAPGSRLDRKQLTALFGAAVPNGVGQACSGIGTVCAPPVNGIVRECGGFSDTCDSTGTEDIIPISFLCLPGGAGNVCTAIAGQNQQTISCTVPTDGKACSTGCGGSFCATPSNICAHESNRVQNCLSGGVCSNNSCINQTFTQNIVGVCERDTEGQSCTPLGGCSPPKAGLCTVSGQCACLLGRQ